MGRKLHLPEPLSQQEVSDFLFSEFGLPSSSLLVEAILKLIDRETRKAVADRRRKQHKRVYTKTKEL